MSKPKFSVVIRIYDEDPDWKPTINMADTLHNIFDAYHGLVD